jgi:formylmethanofuran dehydrogenase subunit E
MALLAGDLLKIDLPQTKKQLLSIVETDGCAVDGISVASNCTVGHRTLRIEDYTGRAIRIAPRHTIRSSASDFAPPGSSKWKAQLIGYQRMPYEQLFLVQEVELVTPLEKIVSRAGKRVYCQSCGEEILNEREVLQDGIVLCRGCTGGAYYRQKDDGAIPDSIPPCLGVRGFWLQTD